MSRISVLSKPLPDASLPRNAFDRGFGKRLNWSAGMILPVFYEFVPAGSNFKINRRLFMRSSDVNTAAFPSIDTHIDFYAVPIRLLFSRYDEFRLLIGDPASSALLNPGSSPSSPSPTPPHRLPYMKTSTLQSVLAAESSSPHADVCGYPWLYGAGRLMDLLHYKSENYDIELNLLKVAAYQKVYFDHYRNTAYESSNPYAYNLDWLYQGSPGSGELTDSDVIRQLFMLRYVNYRKDFFQNIYPSLNYVISSPSGLNWTVPDSVVNLGQSKPVASSDGRVKPAGSQIVQTALGGTTYVLDNFTIQNIRAAFALDKLLRASSYAPKHVKDQYAARYGVKFPDTLSFESNYLGSFKSDLVIGEVTSTADTGATGSRLGAIGGKGVSGSGFERNISHTCIEDSIVMGVMYTMVRSSYDSDRMDAFNMKHLRTDLPVPEFMDLGLRPVTRMEFRLYDVASASIENNRILGYVPRDQEYKLGITENHGLFTNGKALSAYVNHTNVGGRSLAQLTDGVSAAFFKTSPGDLDSIFVQAHDGSQNTDQFFGQIDFMFDSNQNMSVHGQPRL